MSSPRIVALRKYAFVSNMSAARGCTPWAAFWAMAVCFCSLVSDGKRWIIWSSSDWGVELVGCWKLRVVKAGIYIVLLVFRMLQRYAEQWPGLKTVFVRWPELHRKQLLPFTCCCLCHLAFQTETSFDNARNATLMFSSFDIFPNGTIKVSASAWKTRTKKVLHSANFQLIFFRHNLLYSSYQSQKPCKHSFTALESTIRKTWHPFSTKRILSATHWVKWCLARREVKLDILCHSLFSLRDQDRSFEKLSPPSFRCSSNAALCTLVSIDPSIHHSQL